MIDIFLSAPMILFLGLFTKHFFIDFPLQYPFQYLNKGTYGHIGGILHSLLHAIGTFGVVLIVGPFYVAIGMALIDGLLHYHIDWAKVNINKKMGWGPTTHERFWTLLGLDQLLHVLTYWIIIGLVISWLI